MQIAPYSLQEKEKRCNSKYIQSSVFQIVADTYLLNVLSRLRFFTDM